MKQEYSLAHLTMLDCAPPEMIHIAARAGYDYVSLRPVSMRLPGEPVYSLADNKDLLQQTRAALAATGMRVHDIELMRIHDTLEVKSYEAEIAIGAELGAKAMICSLWTDDRNCYIEKFAALCDLARPYGMTVDLEFVCLSSVKNLAGVVLRTVNRENAGLMIDMLHAHFSGDNPADLDDLPDKWFNFSHINDAPKLLPQDRDALVRIVREDRLYLGEGGIDLAGILSHMPQTVYSIELPNAARVKQYGYAEHAFRCLETAKAYVAAHPETRARTMKAAA
jgi:sugar phosphate isomerase/epimerase